MLHNFIRREMAIDPIEEAFDNQPVAAVENLEDDDYVNIVETSNEWTMWRQNLANEMWEIWRANRT